MKRRTVNALLLMLAGFGPAFTVRAQSGKVASNAMKSPAGVDYASARKGDVSIEYVKQGQGPVIVLLPSLGRGAEDFEELARLLAAKGFCVVRPQPRGIGKSTGPLNNLTLTDVTADVALVIEALGTSPVVVAGHAFGNFVARKLATVRPELVRGVAIIAGSPGKAASGGEPFDPGIMEAITGSGDLSLPDEVRLKHLRLAFFAPGSDPRVWLSGWHKEAKAAQMSAFKASKVDEYFAAGNAPVLDIQAEDDTVAPRKHAMVLKNALGDRVTIKLIPHAGHALVPERPREVSEALADWVNGLR